MPNNQNNVNERYGFQMTGIAAAICGTGGSTDCVLQFNADPVATGQYAVPSFATVVRDAVLGTRIRFIKRGLWRVSLCILCSGANTVQGAISLDESLTTLAQDPLRGVVGGAIRAFDRYNGQAAGDSGGISIDAIIPVTQAMVNDPTGALANVRGRASNGANGTPVAAGIDIVNCFLDVELVGDLPGN